jgi:hypothetical protein
MVSSAHLGKEDTMSNQSRTKSNSTAHVVKLAHEIAQALDKIEARLGDDTPAMTTEDKKRSLKPRKGAGKVIETLAMLVKQHGLDSAALSADAMLENVAESTALEPVEIRLQKALKRVSDNVYRAQTGAWDKALQFYALLSRRAKSDGALAASLEPIAAFFARRHESVLADKPTKLQRRAVAKLRRAEELVAHARARVGSVPAAAPPGTPANGTSNGVSNGAGYTNGSNVVTGGNSHA